MTIILMCQTKLINIGKVHFIHALYAFYPFYLTPMYFLTDTIGRVVYNVE